MPGVPRTSVAWDQPSRDIAGVVSYSTGESTTEFYKSVCLGLHSRTQGQVAPYMVQFGPVMYRCWPSMAGQAMTNAVHRIFGVCANECEAQIGPGE